MPPVVGSVTRNHSISHAGTIRHSSHGDVGWLDPASAVAAAAATTGSSASGGGRVSTAVSSSRPQPSEADSIRSMSPEVGWIEEEERGNTVGEMGEAKRVSVMGKRRASRLSMNEGAILWGKLTSQLEEDARTRP
ncbi:hypothetical protein FRC17_005667 [Serendipita sp. 399]|nr:hypothetical protein FRC17_005667 [Serendipita sp. 399]